MKQDDKALSAEELGRVLDEAGEEYKKLASSLVQRVGAVLAAQEAGSRDTDCDLAMAALKALLFVCETITKYRYGIPPRLAYWIGCHYGHAWDFPYYDTYDDAWECGYYTALFSLLDTVFGGPWQRLNGKGDEGDEVCIP